MDQCSMVEPRQKHRMVRIVVVFLQNILKQKLISDQNDINLAIREFCLDHN